MFWCLWQFETPTKTGFTIISYEILTDQRLLKAYSIVSGYSTAIHMLLTIPRSELHSWKEKLVYKSSKNVLTGQTDHVCVHSSTVRLGYLSTGLSKMSLLVLMFNGFCLTLPLFFPCFPGKHHLGTVIASLARNAEHVPYRNSKLTYVLADAFGGTQERKNSDSFFFPLFLFSFVVSAKDEFFLDRISRKQPYRLHRLHLVVGFRPGRVPEHADLRQRGEADKEQSYHQPQRHEPDVDDSPEGSWAVEEGVGGHSWGKETI